MHSHCKDILAGTIAKVIDLALSSITAGSGSDNAEITSDVIDIETLDARPAAIVIDIPVNTTLASDETLTVTGKIEKSADNSTWSDLTTSATLLTQTATGQEVVRLGADLIESDCRYIRHKITPDLSASGTDTVVIGMAIATFGGLDRAT